MYMRTTAQDAALKVFVDDAISDKELSYPNGTGIVAWERTDRTTRIVWRRLTEVRPALLIRDSALEMLFEPIQTGPIRHLRNRLLHRIAIQKSYIVRDADQGNSRPLRTHPARVDIGLSELKEHLTLS